MIVVSLLRVEEPVLPSTDDLEKTKVIAGSDYSEDVKKITDLINVSFQ